jgi:2-polyprenyl-3-methyl-5-hydroxy-6-metoxy-1,4-benzoquinol methylase
MTNNLSPKTNAEEKKDFEELKKLITQTNNQNDLRKKAEYLLKKYPNHPGLQQTLASIYLNLDENEKSINILKKIIKEKNDNEYTHYFLLINYARKENYLEVINSFNESIKIKKDFIEVYKIFFNHISSLKINDYKPLATNEIKNSMVYASKNNFHPMRDLKKIYQNIILEDLKDLKETILKGELINFEINYSLENKSFLQYFLKKTTVTNLNLEELMAYLRSAILKGVCNNLYSEDQINSLESLCVSIFIQSNLNGHIWLSTNEYKTLFYGLIKRVKEKIKNNKQISVIEILIIGSFIDIRDDYEIKDYIFKKFKKEHKEIYSEISFFFNELSNDKKLLKKIKKGKNIKESTSKKIEDFYNENPPLPWGKIKTEEEIEFLEYLRINIEPINLLGKKEFPKSPKILYVGCGSGRDVLRLNTIKNSEIDVIDVSIKNLLYTQKKALEHNIVNINLHHLDYLDIGTLNKKYDVIILNKVLNLIDNFDDGFNLMLKHLNNGGFSQISLKSPIANKEIDIMRKKLGSKINENLKDNNIIQNIREFIIKNNDIEFNRIKVMNAFFEKKSLKKLLNPMYKSLIDIREIKDIIITNKLEFIGWSDFNLNRKLKKIIFDLYSTNYKDDFLKKNLDNWNTFEEENPIIFSTRYKFWIRKND